jgi:beta-xylosidase
MKPLLLSFVPVACLLAGVLPAGEKNASDAEAAGGWVKYEKNPVLGGPLGTCFDVSVLREGDTYRMWFSWRPRRSIALVESKDGLSWGQPRIVLGPNKGSGWEEDVNRPVVIHHGGKYHMWYTGQAKGKSWIGYATSTAGKSWDRAGDRPVLSPEQPWEREAVMCPHALYDGEDGRKWTRHEKNPIFRPDPKNAWEKDRVTACQVVRRGGWHFLFYIGFADRDHAQIGLARSKDGITGWERHPANPILRPGKGRWDADAVYKPYAIFDGRRWLLWYNGRRGGVEQIGVAIHDGEDLGF